MPRPPPSPFTGYYSIWQFLSQRVADLTHTSDMVFAAGLDTYFNDPSLQLTCFFPDDAVSSCLVTLCSAFS
jgi:hypothetical protein